MGRPRAFSLRDLWIVLDAGGRRFAGQGSARGSRGPDHVERAVRPGRRRGSRPQGEGVRAADRPMQGRVARGGQDRPGDREKTDPSACGAECEAEIEDLALAPSKTAAELQCWKSGGSARPFQRPRGNPDRRENAGLEGSANCLTFPKRTWRRRQARARDRRLVKGPGTP